MSTSTLASPAIAAFATAVRAALADLAPDEIDELTDGLEADLTDRLSDTETADLGDPHAYAEELRAAAGLPHRPAPRAGFAAELRHAPKIVAAAFREFGAAHPLIGYVRDFLVALRPLWWVFRAAVITALIGNVTNPGWSPVNGFTLIVGIAALVISVQFGRGKWLPRAWMRGLMLAINVILIACTPFVVSGAATTINQGWYSQTYANQDAPDLSHSGLMENGNPVTNIFAYDGQGKPLTNVQLFDQNGKPLDLSGDPGAGSYQVGDSRILVPSQEVPGRLGWNVYPLSHVSADDLTDGGAIKHSVTPEPATPPFAVATPLAGSAQMDPTPSASVPAPPTAATAP